MNTREGFVVQNPVLGVGPQHTVASIEEDKGTGRQHIDTTNDGNVTEKEHGTLYVGVKHEGVNPVEELDRVARDNLTTMNMQFQGLHKEYVSDYCKNTLVREAQAMIQGDAELDKNHSTFQSYNAGGRSSCPTKNVIAIHDDVVKKEIERYAGNRPLLPEQYESRSEGTALVDRMRELDERMKKAIETNDSDFNNNA
jgi:hypothetical protein